MTFGYLEVGFALITNLWFYAVIFCKANDEAEKHNEITNANKARALKTFLNRMLRKKFLYRTTLAPSKHFRSISCFLNMV